MGPIAVAAHLAPYLPGHPPDAAAGLRNPNGEPSPRRPGGSASILVISRMYIRMAPTG